MKKSTHYLLFVFEKKQYALHISVVEKIFRVVEITPLPKAPDILLGVINIQDCIIPVLNIRHLLGLPLREINLTDQLVTVRIKNRIFALLVDEVVGLIECKEEDIIEKDSILPGTKYIEGVIKLQDEIILIHNIEDFLSLSEAEIIQEVVDYKKI